MKTWSLTRVATFLAMSALLLSTVGCVEEKDTLTVYPSGAGKIHLYQKLGVQLSGMVTGFAEKGKEQQALDSSLYKDLSKWQGISAWAPVKAMLADGQVVYEATGYFDDVTALKKTDGDNVDTFLWAAVPAGGFSFTWKSGNGAPQQPFADTTTEQDQMLTAMMEGMKGLRIEHAVVMPGAVDKCSGCTEHKDRTAAHVITDDDVIKLFALQKDYRARIANNQITKEKATAEFTEKTKSLMEDLVVSTASSGANTEFEQFQKEYRKAKTDAAASGIADKIQQAAAH